MFGKTQAVTKARAGGDSKQEREKQTGKLQNRKWDHRRVSLCETRMNKIMWTTHLQKDYMLFV